MSLHNLPGLITWIYVVLCGVFVFAGITRKPFATLSTATAAISILATTLTASALGENLISPCIATLGTGLLIRIGLHYGWQKSWPPTPVQSLRLLWSLTLVSLCATLTFGFWEWYFIGSGTPVCYCRRAFSI